MPSLRQYMTTRVHLPSNVHPLHQDKWLHAIQRDADTIIPEVSDGRQCGV